MHSPQMYTLFFADKKKYSSYSSSSIMRRSLPFPGCVRTVTLLLCFTQTLLAMVLNNSTQLKSILDKYSDKDEEWWRARSRGRRAISEGDMHLILDLHNKLRGQVHPPASNMEYMVSVVDTVVCFRGASVIIQRKSILLTFIFKVTNSASISYRVNQIICNLFFRKISTYYQP